MASSDNPNRSRAGLIGFVIALLVVVAGLIWFFSNLG